MWDFIFPYADLSAVWCPSDKKPMYTYEAFMQAVDWMNAHPRADFHGFGTSSADAFVNKHEVAAYFANMQQEVGDKSLAAPYPWSWPKVEPTGAAWEGSAGGGISLIEGVAPVVAVHEKGTPPPFTGQLSFTLSNPRPIPKKVLGLRDNEAISCVITDLSRANLPGYSISGAVSPLPGLTVVSQDGTLYGDQSRSKKDVLVPFSKIRQGSKDPRDSCSEAFCSFQGRSILQLSYHFNASDCSTDLFGDYRLVRYPNLLVTVDRVKWNGFPKIFGFPGPRLDGSNPLPKDVEETTPDARILGHLSCLWFWMTPRSGRKISCHGCMLQPTKYGITSVNCVVNNQSGLDKGTWAADKLDFYRRICRILNIEASKTIVSPPGQL